MPFPPYFSNNDFNQLYAGFISQGFSFSKTQAKLDQEFQQIAGWFTSNLSNIKCIKHLLIGEACPPNVSNYIYNTPHATGNVANHKKSRWIIEPYKFFVGPYNRNITKAQAVSSLNSAGVLLIDVIPFTENYSKWRSNKQVIYQNILDMSLQNYFYPKIQYLVNNGNLCCNTIDVRLAGTKIMGDVLLDPKKLGSHFLNSFIPHPCIKISNTIQQSRATPYPILSASSYKYNVCDTNGPNAQLF